MILADFAERLGVVLSTAVQWESRSTNWRHDPQTRNLMKLAAIARETGWNPDKCTGFCKR